MAFKGHKPWNKGIKAKDDERIKKFVDAGHLSRIGKSPWNKGIKTGLVPKTAFKKGSTGFNRKHTEASKEKMRLANLGKHYSPETQFKKGNIPWHTGTHYSESWFIPYTTDWTKTLKQSIRERDHYTCQLCGEKQGDRAWSIHHIDYNKQNCDPKNLITLCTSCHQQTNFNRKYWTEYFQNYGQKI